MSVAKYILIVEKESGHTFLTQIAFIVLLNLNVMDYLIGFVAVFQRLANDRSSGLYYIYMHKHTQPPPITPKHAMSLHHILFIFEVIQIIHPFLLLITIIQNSLLINVSINVSIYENDG